MDYSPPGFSVHGTFQARIVEWVTISSSRGSSWPRVEPESLTSSALAGGFFTTEPPEKATQVNITPLISTHWVCLFNFFMDPKCLIKKSLTFFLFCLLRVSGDVFPSWNVGEAQIKKDTIIHISWIHQPNVLKLKTCQKGLSRRSSGSDTVLLLQGAQVWPLIRELRSCMPHSMAKRKKKKCQEEAVCLALSGPSIIKSPLKWLYFEKNG